VGSRGPRPKPSHIKLLEGTFRPDRAPKHEPKPPKGHPACPTGLGRVAKQEWRRIIPQLDEMGILAKCDRAVISAYCQTWQRWMELEKAVEEHGFTYTTAFGQVCQRPEVALASKAAALLKQLAAELGLSPSARSRVEVKDKKKPEVDATEALLFGKRRRGA